MKSRGQILDALAPIYRDIGKDPRDLIDVRPSYGGWLNALWFEVVRVDGATTWVSREGLDTNDSQQLRNALLSFHSVTGNARTP